VGLIALYKSKKTIKMKFMKLILITIISFKCLFSQMEITIYNENKALHNDENWYWVKDKFCEAVLEDNSKMLISFGSLVPYIKDQKHSFMLLPNGDKAKLNKKSLLSYLENHLLENIITYSKTLIGIPYLWGGKSSYGYDCSGLIQNIYKINGYNFPRDCSIQIKSDLIKEISKDKIKKGDLVYFIDHDIISHVGIFINNKQYIHSSGQVKINSIYKNDDDFNDKLYNMIHGFYSIK